MSLPKNLAPHRPDVFSDTVAHRAFRDGINLNEAADREAFAAAPVSALPKHMQPTAEAAAEHRRKAAELDAEVQRKAAYDHATQCMVNQLAQDRTNIDAGKFRFEQAKADVAGFEAAFSAWTKNPWSGVGSVCERVSSTLIAERMIIAFPRWIEIAEKEAAALEAEIKLRVAAARESRN